ncbi:MAG: HPr family phosphocarrier protein [Verrucomicrobia bacterium]|jgi:phosphocarrier protein HPr|nr:HPr family phosphocarrier protein [Verrucomicrobiota bacterium]NDF17497.1 HPr family phosphocarrier protein [Verrucomicrobiota bacterium]
MAAGEGGKHGQEAVIKNRLGLHARPAAMFVREANRHKCEIHVEKDGETINGKSIMGLMMLAAGMGSRIRIVATGPGAPEAVQALLQLVERKFDEE